VFFVVVLSDALFDPTKLLLDRLNLILQMGD